MGIGVQRHALAALRSGKGLDTRCTGGPVADLAGCTEEKNPLPQPKFEHPTVQLVESRCIDCAVPPASQKCRYTAYGYVGFVLFVVYLTMLHIVFM
jgi:hypothetical protein